MTLLAISLAYLLGSVPTGYWLGRVLRGVDIREHGSKNIGATNTLRVLGKGLGAAALAGDMAKGVLSVLFIAPLSPWEHAPLACGLAAIAGHTLSIFLKFRGGKGVATSAGVFAALCPIPMAIAIAVFVAVVAATRMVSAASMTAALAMTVAVWRLPPQTLELQIVATLVALLVIVRHRANLGRILRGEEPRLGQPKNLTTDNTDGH